MEKNRKDQFSQPQKKTEMPERKREDMSGGPRTTSKPEIDLPLKGGRSESDLSSVDQPGQNDGKSPARPNRPA
jgi:hypothetical protein